MHTLKFHRSGVLSGVTVSYPMAIKVPSLRSVININISTYVSKHKLIYRYDVNMKTLATLSQQ